MAREPVQLRLAVGDDLAIGAPEAVSWQPEGLGAPVVDGARYPARQGQWLEVVMARKIESTEQARQGETKGWVRRVQAILQRDCAVGG